MEKRAKEFLELTSRLYEENKRKWKVVDEDIYQDTIIKVYDAILKGEDTDGDIVGYWYRSYKNNLKREKSYQKNKDKEDISVAYNKESEEEEINLYYSNLESILLQIRKIFDRRTFEVFRMYLLCDMSYEQLNQVTGLCDCKERISRVRKFINGIKDNR